MSEEKTQFKIGVPKETFASENRVALVPDAVAALIKDGHSVAIESGAGLAAGHSDDAYLKVSATIASSREELFSTSDVILQVRAYGTNIEAGKSDLAHYKSGQLIIGHFDPLSDPSLVEEAAATSASVFAMELVPRTTRAQSMDALSSMATIAGYQAVLLAASACPKMFPLLMTAAGTVAPAHVFVVGAGVAGLQAIATAKRLGAIVHAYDVRPAVKEQVESLGGKFVELDLTTEDSETSGGYAKAAGEDFYKKQREMMATVIKGSDVVITTAAVPGRKAPILVTKDMVELMNVGSVVLDLAAERGGNCELTKPGETVYHNGRKVIGPMNLASTIPYHASQMYARNLVNLLKHIARTGGNKPDRSDDIIAGTMLTCDGKIVNEQLLEIMNKKTEQA